MNNEQKLLNIIKVINEAMDELEEGPISEGYLVDIEDGEIKVDAVKFWDDNHNKGVGDEVIWNRFQDRLETLFLAIGYDINKPMRGLYGWLRYENPYTAPKKEMSHK